jgi:hypothetical protein
MQPGAGGHTIYFQKPSGLNKETELNAATTRYFSGESNRFSSTEFFYEIRENRISIIQFFNLSASLISLRFYSEVY